MENLGNGNGVSFRMGDRLSSDVVVRFKTPDGRDDRLYCHSSVLTNKCKYFAERLSDSWPTCQILDARSCVEVHCQESDFNHHITVLRLLYVLSESDILIIESWPGVRNALGVLRVAVGLGCPQIVASCINYLEAVPWDEHEEEEILETIPSLGSPVEPILARLQPVGPAAVGRIFASAIQFATSSPPDCLSDLKSSAQEQIDYMLTEDDDDSPLLTAHEEIKHKVLECMKKLFSRFTSLLESLLRELQVPSPLEPCKFRSLVSYLSDLSWACQILSKLDMFRELVVTWTESSETILKIIQEASSKLELPEVKSKVIIVAAKVLDAIGCGTVILPPTKRLHMVRLWLPFVRMTRPIMDNVDEDDGSPLRIDCELWRSLESAFVSIILALPSVDQAEILREWLGNHEHIQYPDLTEAFEVWCYRTKVAKKRLASIGGSVV